MSAEGMWAFLRPLRILTRANYRWYWASGFGMAGAQGLTQFAITWLVLDITGSTATLGLVIVSQGLPMTLIALFGGVLADRYDRRKLLAVTQTVSMLSMLGLAILTLLDLVQLWHVIANSILLGTSQSLTAPARQAIIASLIEPEERINAVALNSVQQHVSRIVWPSVAAGLITLLGVGSALLVTAACFCLGAVGMVRLKGLRQEINPNRLSAAQQVIEGISYARSTPGVSRVIGLTLVFGLFSLSFIQLAPGFARAGLGFNAAEAGLFMLCLGIGAIVGGAVFSILRVTSTPSLCVLAMMTYSLSLVLFAVNPWYFATFAIAVLNGFANSMEVIMPNAYFQTVVPSQYLGRVISLWFLAAGFAALSALPIGVLGDLYGLRAAFGGVGAIFIVIALWVGLLRPYLFKGTVRRLPAGS